MTCVCLSIIPCVPCLLVEGVVTDTDIFPFFRKGGWGTNTRKSNRSFVPTKISAFNRHSHTMKATMSLKSPASSDTPLASQTQTHHHTQARTNTGTHSILITFATTGNNNKDCMLWDYWMLKNFQLATINRGIITYTIIMAATTRWFGVVE